MKRIWVKPAWEEDDLDLQVRARITSVGGGALLKLWVSHTDPSQQPANHIDRIATGSADNGSLGPDNLADLPPGRIHSYYFSSGIHGQSPSVLSFPGSSDLDAEGGRKTDTTTTPSRRFAGLHVLINLFFTSLSWIFSEKRILWAFKQYGIILGLSIFGRLWHQLKIALGLQPDKETQSRAHSIDSAGEEVRPSQDQSQESSRERGNWGPHRKPLGTTAWDEMKRSYNQDSSSLQDHLESLYGILNLHLQARCLTHCSAALQFIKRLVDDLSQTRQEFVDGGIGLEQQHVRARTQWYNFLHRLDAVEWAKMAETEIKTLLLQDREDHTDD
ncbi:hypothetical protein INS49_015695 [Diaporthe citri]|uniref:uncharacterized protein n=1 Tax=Diaporthe citri TaxID=83186 RepID=UPI001C80D502|nr:uncharacterized protein INS49_015695 [Diaporthe citri]KAG6356308.1 hypothetical protein INS49_015695 [Diaporthe citri]